MFNDVPEKEREKKLTDGGLDINRLVNISLVNREGNAVIRRHLESLPLESFDSVSGTFLFCLLQVLFFFLIERQDSILGSYTIVILTATNQTQNIAKPTRLSQITDDGYKNMGAPT